MRDGINKKQQGHVLEGKKRTKDTVSVRSKMQEEGKKQALLHGFSSPKEPVSQDHSTIGTGVS